LAYQNNKFLFFNIALNVSLFRKDQLDKADSTKPFDGMKLSEASLACNVQYVGFYHYGLANELKAGPNSNLLERGQKPSQTLEALGKNCPVPAKKMNHTHDKAHKKSIIGKGTMVTKEKKKVETLSDSSSRKSSSSSSISSSSSVGLSAKVKSRYYT